MTASVLPPPELTEADLVSRIDQVVSNEDSLRFLAVHGRWAGPAQVKSTLHGTFAVVPAQSEMHLRSLLPPRQDEQKTVFVVPWTTERLPLDLAGRFVRKGKVQLVGAEDRLLRMFRVRSLGDTRQRSPKLASHILRYADKPFSTSGNRLTRDVLWDTWLYKLVGAPEHRRSTQPLAELFSWSLSNKASGADVASEVDETLGLRNELDEVLKERFGPGAPHVWRAWEQGKLDDLLVACVWMEVLRDRAHRGVEQSFWHRRIGTELGIAPDSAAAKTLPACLDFLRKEHPGAVDRACRVADYVVEAEEGSPDLLAALGRSKRLERGLTGLAEQVGLALEQFAESSTEAQWTQVRAAFDALAEHQLIGQRESLRREAEMAVRLAAFLVERSDQRVPSDDSPRAELRRLARWYVAEGGYVDWARGRARRAEQRSTLGKGVRAVAQRVDAIRREMDLTFARQLADWYASGRRGEPLLPIEKASQALGAAFLEESDERRLLVVLLDGMAWAQAAELLRHLEDRKEDVPWGLLAWSAAAAQKHGGDFIPVQAALPTLTEISRASFFAGKAFGPKDRRDSKNDDKRFAANTALRKVEHAGEPVLFMQRDFVRGGGISDDIKRKIQDKGQRVVGVVLNAIDDWLSAGMQQAPEWTLAEVPALRALLEEARSARRVVLLASDHGHVPGSLLEYAAVDKSESPRMRALDDMAAPLAEYEVAFERGQAWAPPGAAGVALIADEHHRYSTKARAGEHGGATLAEVLCPTFLIGWEGLRDELGDDALELLAPVPGWWSLEPELAEAPRTVTQQPAVGLSGPVVRLDAKAEPAKPPVTPPSTPARTPKRVGKHPLLASPMFMDAAKNERDRDRALQAVDLLMGRGGRVNGKAFAGELRVRAASVNGLVARLQRILNQDQASVLRYDEHADQVVLDRSLLEAIFEIEL